MTHGSLPSLAVVRAERRKLRGLRVSLEQPDRRGEFAARRGEPGHGNRIFRTAFERKRTPPAPACLEARGGSILSAEWNEGCISSGAVEISLNSE